MKYEIAIIPAASIIVNPERQRTSMDADKLAALRQSIKEDCLLHAVAVTDGLDLITGGRRRAAIIDLNEEYKYGDQLIPAGYIPALVMASYDEVALFRLELSENLYRDALSPTDEAKAVAKLHRLLSDEHPGNWTKEETRAELSELIGFEADQKAVADSIIIDAMSSHPEVSKAPTRAAALKAAKKLMEVSFTTALHGMTILKSSDFSLLEGDCNELLPTLDPETYAGIIADPPYGMGADGFGAQSFTLGHKYADTPEAARKIIENIFHHGLRVTKNEGHLYMFCDIRFWPGLAQLAENLGWNPYATPLIWHKPNAGHAPQPGFFTRRYEAILFARKGERKLLTSAPDVFTFPAVFNKQHAAEKPVELIEELMKLSFFPGETILDPTAGSGTIFRAAKKRGLRATGIEKDLDSIALCKQAIGEL